MELLLHLWPEDFRSQVDAMNRQIMKDNNKCVQRERSRVPLVLYCKMSVFFDIFVVAQLDGKRGFLTSGLVNPMKVRRGIDPTRSICQQ